MKKDLLFKRTAQFITAIHRFEDLLYRHSVHHQLTPAHRQILQILYFSGPQNLSALSSCMNMNLPNCSREVKKMNLLGYVEKRDSPTDRRMTELSLSKNGRRKIEELLGSMKETFFARSGEWTEKRMKQCIRNMDVLEEDLFAPEEDRD